jgi:hypothetical protein
MQSISDSSIIFKYQTNVGVKDKRGIPLQTISPVAADDRKQHLAITASAWAKEPQNSPALADTFTPSSSSRPLGYDHEMPRVSIVSTAKMQP